MKAHWNTPIYHEGYLYGSSGRHRPDAELRCVEMKTGKVAWEPGRGPGSGSAAVLYADDHLYFRYENGVMALIEATPDSYNLNGSFKIGINNGSSWPHPVVAGGRLYLRDQREMICYDVRQ